MPLGWAGRDLRRCSTTSSSQLKSTRWSPPMELGVEGGRRHLVVGGGGVHGFRVQALEAQHHGLVGAVAPAGGAERAEQFGLHPGGGAQLPVALEPVGERFAARIGPTVCDDDGPMPTENRSRTLSAIRAPRGKRTPLMASRSQRPRKSANEARGNSRKLSSPVFNRITGMLPTSVVRAVPALEAAGVQVQGAALLQHRPGPRAGELERGAVGGQVHHLSRAVAQGG